MKSLPRYAVKLVRENRVSYGETIANPFDAVNLFKNLLEDESQEVMSMIAFNVKHEPIGYFEVCRGGLDKSIASPREIAKRALLINASSVMLAHNHPSGNLNPSRADIRTTKLIKDGLSLLEIDLLDHIIVSLNGSVSLRQEGLL